MPLTNFQTTKQGITCKNQRKTETKEDCWIDNGNWSWAKHEICSRFDK